VITIEAILLAAAVLLLVAVLASKASSRLGVPGLLLFLIMGMLAGSDGPVGIPFDNPWQAQALGVLALAFILFSGGSETNREVIAPVLWRGISLATLGVLLTALAVGAFARWALGLSWLEGILLGSIVSSTDAAAVFSILRSRSVSLKGHVKPLLELESGSNDPMAVFLTIGVIQLMTQPGESILHLAWLFVLQMGIGAAAGLAAGRLAITLMNRLKLEAEGLYPVLSIALVLLTYGATALLKGNGFLAVYLAGIVIGNGDFIHTPSILRFHDGLAWLMQIVMFLALGLLVFPSRLPAVAGSGLLLAGFLMLVARPAAVFLSLSFARMRTGEKLLVGWVGLRGAVPIILATFPRVAGVPNAEVYFDLVFFIVLTSVMLQGTTIPLVARRLGLEAPLSPRKQYPLEFLPTQKTRSDMVEITLPENSPAVNRQIVDLRLPRSALIVLIARNDDFLSPRGGTILRAGDTLLVLVDKRDIAVLRSMLDPAAGIAS
jgi:cell volume regulation protein A